MVHNEKFKYRQSPVVSGVAACVTTLAATKMGVFNPGGVNLEPFQYLFTQRSRLLAFLANLSDQSLRYNQIKRRRQQIRLDTHIDQTRYRAGGVVGVEGAEHKVARQ